MKNLSSPIDLIKNAINLFVEKENLIYLIKVYSPLIPFSILSLALNYLPDSVKNSNLVWFTVGLVILQVLYFLTSVFVTASGIIAVGRVTEGESLSVRITFKSAWRRYWVLLFLSVVLFFINLFGFILLIVPGVIFITWFVFSRFIAVETGSGLKQSLVKSKDLAKGRFWKILGRLIVFGLFTALIEIVLNIIPFGIGSVLSALAGGLLILPSFLLYKELA